MFITMFHSTKTGIEEDDLGDGRVFGQATISGGALEGGDFNSVFTSPPDFVDGGLRAAQYQNADAPGAGFASLGGFRIVPDNGIKYARLGLLMPGDNTNPTEINFIGDGFIRGYHISLIDEYMGGVITSPEILEVYKQVFYRDLYSQRFWK
jgi:hypothetical protein